MRKYFIYSIFGAIGAFIIFIIYFSIFGVKTERFNDLIIDKIKAFDPKLTLDINDVFLKLDLSKKSININTENAKLKFDKEYISLSKIDLNLDILNFIKNENSIKTIKILTKKNKIDKVTSFLNSYKFNLARYIFYNQIEEGYIGANIDINFIESSATNFVFNISGKISDGKLNVLNNKKIEDINFDFNINDKKYTIKKVTFKSDEIHFSSDEILIKKLKSNYEIKGNLENKKGLIDPNFLSKAFNINLDFIENKKILASTYNQFNFRINSKNKIKDLNLSSKINFKEIFINKKIQNLIYFQNGTIISNYNKNNLNIDIESSYTFLNDAYKNSEKDKINININKKENDHFNIKAIIKNKNNLINSSELSNYFKNIDKFVKNQDLIFGSSAQITFSIDKKNKDKIKNLKINSKINLDEVLINYNSSRLNKIFTNYKNIIKTKNNIINVDFSSNRAKVVISSDYSFDKKYDKVNFEVIKNKKNLNFSSKIEINTNPILLKNINYNKKKDISSTIEFDGIFFDNKSIKLKKINFIENKNNFSIINLNLSNNFKIIDFDKINLKYINENVKLNQIDISKNNSNIKLTSESFDGKDVIKNFIKGDSKNSFLNRFENLNSEIKLNFEKFFIDDKDYLKDINGNIIINNNSVNYGNLTAKLNNKNDFNLNIKTNSKKEKITNLFIDKPEPFIKHYKFIKGFNEGILSYKSFEKNGISESKLKISNFKVKEVPVLAKILTLASLQGIADLLTGEGIRFSDFEMDYESSKKTTNIKEMYAIGPAISILMSGYLDKEKLISLRGTLVPATTINKTIAKIPLIGGLLVGKKTGEGVFGVSFKIKGPPKNLKTTVNPVKTLTPRFITRTLEKLKKN